VERINVERTKPPEPVGPCQWAFPDPASAADVEIARGADLEPSTLVHAYRHGIFPWPSGSSRRSRIRAVPWCSPHPRGVLGLDRLYISKTVRQTMMRSNWTTTVNHAFLDVVDGCSQRPEDGTWIIPEMRAAYHELHRLGWAHSLEVWNSDELVGGLYGVMVGGVFTGESMFHRESGASKVAFADLCVRMLEARGAFIDVQLPTEHLESLGVIGLGRSLFLELLHECRDDNVQLVTDRLPVSRLPAEYIERRAVLQQTVGANEETADA
jgi:leucyl/phenylalanyl-tRNA---protein transferase